MIFFPTIGRHGRLGNQLFQYAAGRALSLKHDTDLFTGSVTNKEWHGQKCLLPHFNIKVTETTQELPSHAYQEKDPFRVNKKFFQLPNNVLLNGFFQSIFYFEDYLSEIKKELQLKNRSSHFLNHLKGSTKKEIVSVHLRRGDNTDGTDPSQTSLIRHYDLNGGYEKYISTAMSKFSNAHFLVFTGGKRSNDDNIEDMRWCKNFFKGEEFSFSEGRSAIEDFELISSCDHNILSHASSFGWWAAFLNINLEAKKVAPLNYHPDLENYEHREMFYPKDWVLV